MDRRWNLLKGVGQKLNDKLKGSIWKDAEAAIDYAWHCLEEGKTMDSSKQDALTEGKCIIAGEEVSPEVYMQYLMLLDLADYTKILTKLPVDDDTVVEEQAEGVVEIDLTWGYLMKPLRQKVAQFYGEESTGDEQS